MKGTVDRCRGFHGWAIWEKHIKQYERLNKRLPVIDISVQADGTEVRFQIYKPRQRQGGGE